MTAPVTEGHQAIAFALTAIPWDQGVVSRVALRALCAPWAEDHSTRWLASWLRRAETRGWLKRGMQLIRVLDHDVLALPADAQIPGLPYETARMTIANHLEWHRPSEALADRLRAEVATLRSFSRQLWLTERNLHIQGSGANCTVYQPPQHN